jgi:RimJ/RimL family protein N-acetyltransferase
MWRSVAGNLFYEPAGVEHLEELLLEMRQLDWQEVEAASGDVAVALDQSLKVSYNPVAVRLADGGLVALFGVAPLTITSDTAAIWLLGTDRMRAFPRDVIADTVRYVGMIRERYPRLVNYVDVRNRPSIRWLRHVGFTLDPPAPFGVAGMLFHRFHMGIEDV